MLFTPDAAVRALNTGFCAQAQALLTAASDVDFLFEPAFGHIDHFMTPDHQRYVERPILRWLRGDSP
jgi:hypothetical protein